MNFLKRSTTGVLESDEEDSNGQTSVGHPREKHGEDREEGMNEDGEERMDEDRAERMDEDGENRMEEFEDDGIDNDGDQSDDDDFPQDCRTIDFSPSSIGGLQQEEFFRSIIWIRPEFLRIFDRVEEFFAATKIPSRAPAVIITGQPGIGKSAWLYYALWRYLTEETPVIWAGGGKLTLFVAEGVYEVPDKHDVDCFQTQFIPTLVDEDAGTGIPTNLIPTNTRHAVIYATSPCQDRWKRVHKTMSVITLIMNPWSRKEIYRLAEIVIPSTPKKDIDEVFDRYRPTPRLCIESFTKTHKQHIGVYETKLRTAMTSLTLDALEKIVSQAHTLTMDSLSHKICLIWRKDDVTAASVYVTPITQTIKSRLACHLRNVERAEQIRLYKLFSKTPDSKGVAGILFESLVQNEFLNGVNLEITPMVKLPTARKGALPQWYSSHLFLRNTVLEQSRKQALERRSITIKIPVLTPVEYGDGGSLPIEPGTLYIPQLTNQEAFDSFILYRSILYIFQMTVGKKHEIKPGLISFFQSFSGIPNSIDWRFIFVIGPNQYLTCPQPRILNMPRFQPYSAVFTT